MKSQAAQGSIVHFAKHFPALVFQPSDPDSDVLQSIAAWVKVASVSNVCAPVALNVSHSVWPIASADGIICINMVRINAYCGPVASCQSAGLNLALATYRIC